MPNSLTLLGCSALTLAPASFRRPQEPSKVALRRANEPQLASPETADAVPEGISAADWSSIRTAYEHARHAVHPAGDGYQARNPGQQWTTHFDDRGFTTDPDVGSWMWGLELERYGFPGQEHADARPARLSAQGSRLMRDWDETLTEWYVNDTRGLEHGYTVYRRPTKAGGNDDAPLSFVFAVRGGLQPQVTIDGRGVRFVEQNGAVVLTYTGLKVIDAQGHELEAGFGRIGARLVLSVDEHRAHYPIIIDPVAQQAYLKASNTDPGDSFGWSVAVSGDTVVVGAPGEDSNTNGVNGDQGNDNFHESFGAAYVFVRNGTSWIQEAYLKASNSGARDEFGTSVAISGNTVVVGAPREASSATGVNGDQNDNSAAYAGAAYVFTRTGTNWSQDAYLKASNADAEDRFGLSVAASDDTVVVAAVGEGSNATGVNGNQDDNSLSRSGAVYVFVHRGTTWRQEAYLKASNPDTFDAFGTSVAISGDTIVVGALGEDSGSTGVDGDPSDNGVFQSGAAYVFARIGSSWIQEAYLKASNPDTWDVFGISAGVSDNTVVVGAEGEDSNATGVDGDQTDNSAEGAGAAYIFMRSGTNWNQEAYLKASNTDAGDTFGGSVAVSGNMVLVGAHREQSSATGVNGDQGNGISRTGAAYLFLRKGKSWIQEAYLKASNTGGGDDFGGSVALSSSTVVIGARSEYSSATGVDGDQSDNSAYGAGAAYVFDTMSPGTTFCFGDGSGMTCPCGNDSPSEGEGCLHSGGRGMRIAGSGPTSISADGLVLTVTNAPPDNNGIFYSGRTDLSPGNLLYDGLQCAGGDVRRYRAVGQTTGTVSDTGFVAQDSSGVYFVPGATYSFQYWSRDLSFPSPCGTNANSSPAYAVVMSP